MILEISYIWFKIHNDHTQSAIKTFFNHGLRFRFLAERKKLVKCPNILYMMTLKNKSLVKQNTHLPWTMRIDILPNFLVPSMSLLYPGKIQRIHRISGCCCDQHRNAFQSSRKFFLAHWFDTEMELRFKKRFFMIYIYRKPRNTY